MSRYERLIRFIDRYERPISVVAMVGGFCVDYAIAKRPDTLFVNTLLLSYLLVSAVIIVLLMLPERRASREAGQPLMLLLAMKFSFGGLASNLFILYGKSGTPTGSIVFLALLFGMLVGNEFLKSKYEQLRFNASVWYVLLFTYCIIAVPTWIIHDIGSRAFVASSVTATAAALVFMVMLHVRTGVFRGPEGRRHLRHFGGMVLGVNVFFNALYFAELIPPVPLALRDAGIYHTIARAPDGSYRASYEPASRWRFFETTSDTYTVAVGGSGYCFSSIFAPTDLVTPVRHSWQYFDEASQSWETRATVSFLLWGGREEGYRGYSVKSNLSEGKWRCDVETAGGRIIGRVAFTVIESAVMPTLSETTL